MDLSAEIRTAVLNQNWNHLLSILEPKHYYVNEMKELVNLQTLAITAEALVSTKVPEIIQIVLLKCLGNSSYNGYRQMHHSLSLTDHGKYCSNLYKALAENNTSYTEHYKIQISNSSDLQFIYDGVAYWCVNFIETCKVRYELSSTTNDILRLCIQLLCNLFTFACKHEGLIYHRLIRNCLNNKKLRSSIKECISSEHITVAKAACKFLHNCFLETGNCYFSDNEIRTIVRPLLKPLRNEVEVAKDLLIYLLNQPNILHISYKDIPIADRADLLQIIFNDISHYVYNSGDEGDKDSMRYTKIFTDFISRRFCKRSDLILRTVDKYLKGVDPKEIILLLDILGVLTSKTFEQNKYLQNDKGLFINCTYLLKAVQLAGQESSNHFTPITKLSEIAPSTSTSSTSNQNTAGQSTGGQNRAGKNTGGQNRATSFRRFKYSKIVEEEKKTILENCDQYQNHPSFGFKAGLVRVIGNMVYNNRILQDLLREIDGIPLILECSNFDARNPLITQWAILALRNICKDNKENQEIVSKLGRVGLANNATLKEMGLTVHEDRDTGSFRISPLNKAEKK